MEIRYSWNPEDVKKYTTEELRKHFLIQNLFEKDKINMVYSHVDRIIIGACMPTNSSLALATTSELGTDYFLERREMGVINIGGTGSIILDGKEFTLDYKDGIYIGMGTKEIIFKSADKTKPAKFYFNSAPAHKSYETVKINIKDANPLPQGSSADCNKRVIYQYIHPNVCKSCQLLMGLTSLEPGNVWNTMPCHTHDRRMEVYFYFDLDDNSKVMHFMGEPNQTRHIVVGNEEMVISPSWSIHSGCGTKNYSFIWGMVGENQTFSDMDVVEMNNLK